MLSTSFIKSRWFQLIVAFLLIVTICYSDPDKLSANKTKIKEITSDFVTHSSIDVFKNKLLHFLNIPKNGYFKGSDLSIPQYMISLYKSVAQVENGSSQSSKPYNANKIRSYQNMININNLQFYFNLSQNELSKEDILEAEFRIYKLKPNIDQLNRLISINMPKSNLLEVKIYQVLTSDASKPNRKLLDSRRMSLNSFGWEVFYVKSAVQDWIYYQKPNLGFEITVETIFKEPLHSYLWTWAKGHKYQINKKPVLIIYSNSNAKKTFHSENKIIEHDYGFHELLLKNRLQNKLKENNLKENKLKKNKSKLIKQCKKENFVIDFKKLGWNQWMLYPKKLISLTCFGECYDLENIKENINNAKKFENILNEIMYYSSKSTLACVPSHLASIDILYVEANGDVTLSQVDQVVVKDCKCQ